MYSEKVITARLEAVEKRRGFYPREHSIEEIETYVEHLNKIFDEDGTPRRALTKDEKAFISNEREMCACSFLYWATRYAWIQHFEGGIIRFVPNVAQRIALSLFAKIEELGRSISIQALKARQLGISTLAELCIAHRVQFIPETKSLIGSSDPEKSRQMSEMMTRTWDRMPWWLMPTRTKFIAGETIEFGEQDSSVTISHGSAMSGIGRGSTFQAFHLSELADYLNAKELVDASLIKATHESPFLFRVLESTAKGKGKGNWWYTTWETNKKGYWKGQAKFCAMFLPWYVGTDIYPTRAQARSHPVPKNWEPLELTEAHAQRAKGYVHRNELLRLHLGEDWEMPREQMYYWENERRAYSDKDELEKFYEEMPADDNEAFQSTGTSVFKVDLLSEKRENARAPIGIYAIVGAQSEIPLSRHPSERDIDNRYKPIKIVSRFNPSHRAHEYLLIPLKMDRMEDMDMDNKLVIYEFPDSDHDYGIGVDTGYGVGSDNSVMQVVRKGTMWKNAEQVAEWASNQHNAIDMWPLLMALGTFYSVHRGGRLLQPKIVIEVAANGETLLHEVRKRGLTNHHVQERYDRKKRANTTNRIGWMTVGWSRAMMLDYFINAFRDGYLDLNSPELLNEMGSFAEDPATQKLQATVGYHDDRLMALGIVFFSLTINETKGYTTTLDDRLAQRDKMATLPRYTQERDAGPTIDQMQELESTHAFPTAWGSSNDYLGTEEYDDY